MKLSDIRTPVLMLLLLAGCVNPPPRLTPSVIYVAPEEAYVLDTLWLTTERALPEPESAPTPQPIEAESNKAPRDEEETQPVLQGPIPPGWMLLHLMSLPAEQNLRLPPHEPWTFGRVAIQPSRYAVAVQ